MKMTKIKVHTDRELVINSIGMMVALISFSMLFATLFLGLILYRFSSSTWPPLNLDRVDLFYPSLSSIIIIVSSWTYEVVKEKMSKGPGRYYYLITLFLGVLFLVCQFYFWNDLKSVGIFASSGIYGSLIYAFSWIHVGHVLLGIGLLLFFTPQTWKGRVTKTKLVNIGKFWHFLTIIWIMIYFLLFVI
jgi:cytochrome c oxidase subunit 3